MKKCKKTAILLVVIMILLAVPLGTYAKETARISVGSGSCDIGDEITISVNVGADTEIYMCDIWLSYDSDILQPVSGYDKKTGSSVRILSTESTSFNVKFKAIAAGTSSISVNTSNTIVSSMTEDSMTISAGAGSVTVKAPVTYSTDNTLASLDISQGVLSPAFSPNVTSYTTTVGADCDKLVVSAIANDDNATVTVKGTRMDPGSNKTTVTVTAQDGSVKVYTISTTKDDSVSATQETDEQETASSDKQEQTSENEEKLRMISIGEAQYEITDDFEMNPLPSGYEEIEYEYNGISVKAGKGTNTKLILMYLENTDEKGSTGFYVYDSVSKNFAVYIEAGQPDITYAILPITDKMEKPDGYKKTTYSIAGYAADVLMDADGKYCLFYGVSSSGVTGWFRYDCSDGTIQAYSSQSLQTVNEISQEENQSTSDTVNKGWQFMAIIFMCITALLVVVLFILAVKLSNRRRELEMAADNGYDYEEDDEYDFDSYEEDDDEQLDNDILEEDEVVNSITEALSQNDGELEFLDIQDVDDIKRT